MLVTGILDEVLRDLASFSDPGTEVRHAQGRLSWTRSRVQYEALLVNRGAGFPDVMFEGTTFTYEGFLASTALSDLRDLAQAILSTVKMPLHFLECPARDTSSEEPASTEPNATELIRSRTETFLPFGATRVLFLHGNAGAGKTSTLEVLSLHQAERYLRGETTTLYLYLDAQGKGLTMLEDVMARALQDLRAKFTYHSVAALTRRHCVVPIVDGFDELIGPSSAREAFSNLAQFLAQLDCGGALIASSRSAFLDYGTLHESAAEIQATNGLSYEILPVEVLDWPAETALAYCRQVAPGDERLSRRVSELLENDTAIRPLLRKPFFLSRVCGILTSGGEVDPNTDLVEQIVNAGLEREAGKLKDPRGKPILSSAQHREFCESIADEMWNQGVADLDIETIRVLAELVAEGFGLAAKESKIFIDRAQAHGLLSRSAVGHVEKRRFEHEVFRFEFLAARVARSLQTSGEACKDYIQRADIPRDVVERTVRCLGVFDDRATTLIECLCENVTKSGRNAYAGGNAGAMVAAMFRRVGVPLFGAKMWGLQFRSDDFGGVKLKSAYVRECIFEQVDFSRAAVVESGVVASQFLRCVVGASSSFAGTKLNVEDFAGVVCRGPGGKTIEIFDPREIRSALVDAGALIEPGAATPDEPLEASEKQREAIALVEKVLKHGRSHFYISLKEPWAKKNLAVPEWLPVEKLLKEHELIEYVKVTKSGAPESFLRFRVAPDLILGARSGPGPAGASMAAEFWRKLGGASYAG
jgi:hypothetical protein